MSNTTRFMAGVCANEGYSMAKQALPDLKQEVITREVYIKHVYNLVRQHVCMKAQ